MALPEEFLQLAIRAHNGTSFSPERRGQNLFSDFDSELTEDLKTIGEIPGITQDQIDRYKEGYLRYLRTWLARKSNCISAMITGPAKFPTRRAEKANNSEHNAYSEFRNWRERALKAIKKKNQPEPEMSEIDRIRREISQRETMQTKMKEANKIIRKGGDSVISDLQSLGFKNPQSLLVKDNVHGHGFPQFQLTNNLASIKRLKDRLTVLETKEQSAAGGNRTTDHNGIQVVENYDLDRVQILFPGKPDPDTISKLKSNGWNWSPSNQAWQRKLTQYALINAQQILKPTN